MGLKTKGTIGAGFIYAIDFLTGGQLSAVLFGSTGPEELSKAALCWMGTLIVGPIWEIPGTNIPIPGINLFSVITMAFLFVIARGLFVLFYPSFRWNRKKVLFGFLLMYPISKAIGSLLWNMAGPQCVVNAIAINELVGPFTIYLIAIGLFSALLYIIKHREWFSSSGEMM